MTLQAKVLFIHCALATIALAPVATHAQNTNAPAQTPAAKKETPNARLELQRANELLRRENTGGKLTPAQESEVLERNQDALKILRDALEMPFEPQPLGADLTIPFEGVARYRNLARFLALASRVQLRAGNLDGAAQSALDTMRMAHLIQNGGAIFISLTGQAIEAIGRKNLREVLPKLDAPTATRIAQQIENLEQARIRWAQIIQNDSAMYRQETARTIAATFPDQANRDAVAARYDELMEWQIAQAKTPYLLSDARGTGDLEDILGEDDEDEVEEDEAQPAPLPDVNMVAENLFEPSRHMFGYARFGYESSRATNLLLMTQFALRAFEVENKRPAKTLNELVPGYLQRVPLDPFDLEAPLQWKERDGKWVLYSIGPDGLDDGGLPPADPKNPAKTLERMLPDSRGDIIFSVDGS